MKPEDRPSTQMLNSLIGMEAETNKPDTQKSGKNDSTNQSIVISPFIDVFRKPGVEKKSQTLTWVLLIQSFNLNITIFEAKTLNEFLE